MSNISMPIGPSLPPHLAHLAASSSRSISPPAPLPQTTFSSTGAEDDDEDDDYGPALPPQLAAARQAGPSRPAVPSYPQAPPRPVTLPAVTRNEYDDDDDDIGPKPVSSHAVKERNAVEEFKDREARWAKEREEASKPKKLEREEWMLVPPTSGPLSSVDPLRKRPTTFSKSTREPNTDSSIWTETPTDKAQRLADEVAGIKRKKPPKSGEVGVGDDERDMARKMLRDREILDEVERHNKEQRGTSLLAKHAKAKAEGKGDKEGPVIWDHDRDMGITGRLLNDQERQAKIREARGLNDRFGHGKRGAYDM